MALFICIKHEDTNKKSGLVKYEIKLKTKKNNDFKSKDTFTIIIIHENGYL